VNKKFLIAAAVLIVAATLMGARPALSGLGSGNDGERTWLSQLRLT